MIKEQHAIHRVKDWTSEKKSKYHITVYDARLIASYMTYLWKRNAFSRDRNKDEISLFWFLEKILRNAHFSLDFDHMHLEVFLIGSRYKALRTF